MKNKIICIFILVFSVSFFSSAKKYRYCCPITCAQLEETRNSEIKMTSIDKDNALEVPELGNIFLVF